MRRSILQCAQHQQAHQASRLIGTVSSGVEHCLHTAGVTGSIPVPSTITLRSTFLSWPFLLRLCAYWRGFVRKAVTSECCAIDSFWRIFLSKGGYSPQIAGGLKVGVQRPGFIFPFKNNGLFMDCANELESSIG